MSNEETMALNGKVSRGVIRKWADKDFTVPVFAFLIFLGIVFIGCMVLCFFTIEQFWSYGQFEEKITAIRLHLNVQENFQTNADADVLPAAWLNDLKQLEEEAKRKIALLSEEIMTKQLTRNLTLLGTESSLKVSTADEEGSGSEEFGLCSVKELQDVRSSLKRCQAEREDSETRLKQCQGNRTDAADVLKNEVQLKTCQERNAKYEASLARVTDLRSKNEELAIKIKSLKDSLDVSTGHFQSCQTELQNNNNTLTTCQKELLTEDALEVKLQKLREVNAELTARNNELNEEAIRCEQDRSAYHIRMQQAEEELQKIRNRPLDE